MSQLIYVVVDVVSVMECVVGQWPYDDHSGGGRKTISFSEVTVAIVAVLAL